MCGFPNTISHAMPNQGDSRRVHDKQASLDCPKSADIGCGVTDISLCRNRRIRTAAGDGPLMTRVNFSCGRSIRR